MNRDLLDLEIIALKLYQAANLHLSPLALLTLTEYDLLESLRLKGVPA